MKILQVIPHLSKGGAEKMVIDLSNNLADAKNEVTILVAYPVDNSFNQKNLNRTINLRSVSAKRNPAAIRYLKASFFVYGNRKWISSFDIVHCHLNFGIYIGLHCLLLRKLRSNSFTKIITTYHAVGLEKSELRRHLYQKVSRFFDFFVLMAQDGYWREFIQDKARTNIRLIPNGIEFTRRRNDSSSDENSTQTWKVGTISRLHIERQPWLFLEVFSEIHKISSLKTKFLIGGEGPLRKNLIELSGKLGLSEVLEMSGLITDAPKFLREIDVYIGLNVEDVTGIAGLEAVEAGIPVFSIQRVANYSRGRLDWIKSHEDPKIVAEMIINALQNPNMLASEIERQFLTASRNFSLESMTSKYLEIYCSK